MSWKCLNHVMNVEKWHLLKVISNGTPLYLKLLILIAFGYHIYSYYNFLMNCTCKIFRRNEAANRPRETYQPKKLHELNIPSLHDDMSPQVEYGGNFNGGTIIPTIKGK